MPVNWRDGKSSWHESGACWEEDPTIAPRSRLLLAALRQHLPAREPVLDLGCGTGRFSKLIAEAGYPVVGLDIAKEAVEYAQQHGPGIDFRILNDDETIPASCGYFGAVWSSEVIEHVFSIRKHAMEVNRILKDGGVYILTTPFHGIVKNLLVVTLKFTKHFDPLGQHVRFFDKDGLIRYLEYGGFKPISIRAIGRFYPVWRTWFVVARKRGDVRP